MFSHQIHYQSSCISSSRIKKGGHNASFTFLVLSQSCQHQTQASIDKHNTVASQHWLKVQLYSTKAFCSTWSIHLLVFLSYDGPHLGRLSPLYNPFTRQASKQQLILLKPWITDGSICRDILCWLISFHGFLSSFVTLDHQLQATLVYWYDETRGEHVFGLVQVWWIGRKWLMVSLL